MLLSSVALIACMSNSYKIDPIDSPPPSGVTAKPSCIELVQLSANQNQCWMVLFAENKFNNSGLLVNANQTYQIEVPTKQFLYDASRFVAMPNGDNGSHLTRFFSFSKRNVESNWFALMATTEKKGSMAIDISKHSSFSGLEGTLLLYVNDTNADLCYANNHGRLWVKIKLIKTQN